MPICSSTAFSFSDNSDVLFKDASSQEISSSYNYYQQNKVDEITLEPKSLSFKCRHFNVNFFNKKFFYF